MIEASSQTSPANHIIGLREACEKARKVLLQGPTSNPRAILQAYHTFQVRWQIVIQRELTDIDPEVLAIVSLLQYAWPDVFSAVFNSPYLFFYLHALASNHDNKHCLITEVGELYDLGLPLVAKDSPLETFREPDLVRLLTAIPLPDRLNIDALVRHLTSETLIDESLPSTTKHMALDDEHWRALMSGDPGRIKSVNPRLPELQRILGIMLLEQLGALIDYTRQINDNLDSDPPQLEEQGVVVQQAICALFAFPRVRFGRIFDQTLIHTINELMNRVASLPVILLLRAVYTLGHLIADPERDPDTAKLALTTLGKVVANPKVSHAICVRVVRLLGHSIYFESDVITSMLALLPEEPHSHTSSLLRAVTKQSILQASWRNKVLNLLPEGDLPKYATEFIFDLCPETPEWPEKVGLYLLRLATTNQPNGEQAFRLLQGYDGNKTQVVYWLSQLTLNSRNRWQLCLKRMGDLQCEIGKWQTGPWDSVVAEAKNSNRDDELGHLVIALGITHKFEAVSKLEELHKHAKETGKENLCSSILDQLLLLNDAGVVQAKWVFERLSTQEA